MSATLQPVVVERPPPTLVERLATLGALALAAALFQTVGWLAMEPNDPLGPVSLLSRESGLTMLLQAAALTGVAAGLATIVAGRNLIDVGVVAAALGLGLIALRGATAEYLLLQRAEQSATFDRGLALRFALETCGWFFAVMVAIAASAVVMRFCYAPVGRESGSARPAGAPGASTLAGFDLFGLWTNPADGATKGRDGVKHALIACGVGAVTLAVLSVGLSRREIRHGQVCFVVAACVFLGTYAAQRLVPVRSALWAILSVALLAVGGYLWAAIRPSTAGVPAGVPSTHFMRILPVQFICVGTVSAVATFWSVYLPVLDDDEAHRRKARPRHRDVKR